MSFGFFNQLPPELQTHIAKSIFNESSDEIWGLLRDEWDRDIATTTLANLCKASRKTKAIAEPILYSRLHVTSRELYDCCRFISGYETTEPIPRLVSFVCAIYARPELANFVREISIREITPSDYHPTHNILGGPPPHIPAHFKNALLEIARRRLDGQGGEASRLILQGGSRDVVAVLTQMILMQAPQLRFLDLKIASCMSSNWSSLAHIIIAERGNPSSWTHEGLKTLIITHDQSTGVLESHHLSYSLDADVHDEEYAFITACPNLETLQFDRCVKIGPLPVFANLRSVAVVDSLLGAQDVQNLASACVNLASFTYISGKDGSGMAGFLVKRHLIGHQGIASSTEDNGRDPEVTPRQLQDALIRRKDTLEDVHVRFLSVPQQKADDRAQMKCGAEDGLCGPLRLT